MKQDAPDLEWFLEKLKASHSDFCLEEKLVREAIEIIWRKIHCLEDVNAIVSELPTTRRTLERHFREQVGLTISGVVAIARLELAKWLLTETSLPIHVVAKKAGYASSDWMGKAIRRNLGMTPSEFRLSAKKREDGTRK